MSLKRLWYFRTSLVLETLATLVQSGITVLFWQVVFSSVRPLPGWSLGETLAFSAMVEAFYALMMSLFVGSSKLWTLIIAGRLDVYLVRPVDPRLLTTLLTLRPENLVRSIPSIAVLFALARSHGAEISVASTGMAVLVVFLGAMVYAFLQMAGSWASFWIGRSQMLDELTDSVSEFTRYPHSIYPGWFRLVLTSIVPLAFASTEPATVLTGMSSGGGVIVKAVAAAALWWFVQDVLWKKGMQRYDSYGG